MLSADPVMAHSLLSPALNLGLLDPVECAVAAEDAYRAGLAAGGGDDGPPGPRPQYGRHYYACYMTDPDGLRVEVTSRR